MSEPEPQPYTTLASPAQHRQVIENSEFLVYAARADTPAIALAQLADCQQRYPDASHHCWAYQIGNRYRFNDAGEPSGTAGAPIWRAIESQDLDYVMVVVVRYFGGTKLGTGGLARAYGGSSAECLRLADRLVVRPHTAVQLQVPFEYTSQLYHLLGQFKITNHAEDYNEKGICMSLQVEIEQLLDFAKALTNITRGNAILKVANSKLNTQVNPIKD